jgi:hypothetical protein
MDSAILKEAYNMAIQALEQEPCDDAISRNDMLDAVGHGTTYTSLEVQKIINGLPSVNPVPCDDVVSRQAVLKIIDGWYEQNRDTENIEDLIVLITYMDSVRPQEPKTGHWIMDSKLERRACDNCNTSYRCRFYPHNYCPNCGAKMVEP